MKASISKQSTWRIRTGSVLFLGPTLAALLFGQSQVVHAQRTATGSFGTILDSIGIMVNGAYVPGLEATEEQLAGNPPLFENHTEDHLPVLMPDGTTQVTYNDVAAITGTLTVLDVGEQGTQVTVSADGLLPGGLYTAWIDLYEAPGFTPDFAHELAVGALGYDTRNPPSDPYDYTGNVFTADAKGHGELVEAIQPPGPASWFTTEVVDGFEVPPYVLDGPVAEFHVALAYHMDGNSWGPRPGAGEGFDAFDSTWAAIADAFVVLDEPAQTLQAGDADQDLDFDQADLIQVQQAGKYRTGEPATWGQGDWDGAPGGSPGNSPTGNGVFDQFDIITALQGGAYLTGRDAAIQSGGQLGDGQTSVIYNAGTGELSVDAPTGTELTSINIDSTAGIFSGQAAQNLGGSFDNDADNNIFKATFGSSFDSLSFGNVARAGLSEEFMLGDLTVIGSLAGGGDLGNVDLVYVPEPSTIGMLVFGILLGLRRFREINFSQRPSDFNRPREAVISWWPV